MEVPLGPSGAFDSFGETFVTLDEKKNQIILYHCNEDETIAFSIPQAFNTTSFFWTRIHVVDRNVLVCLLKSHATRVFSLVTLRLDHETKEALLLRSLKTKLYSHGYHIQSHRAGNQFVFTFSNGHKLSSSSGSRRKVSDMEMFTQQLRDQRQSQESANIPSIAIETDPPGPIRRVQSESACETVREGVMLIATVTDYGRSIRPSVASLGKQRFGVKFRRVNSIRRLHKAIGIKFMSKYGAEEADELLEPFFLSPWAVLLCRNRPSHCLLIRPLVNPSHGVFSAISNFFRNLNSDHHTPNALPLEDQMQCSIAGEPPAADDEWSNLDVVEGRVYLQTHNISSGDCRLHCLRMLSGGAHPRLSWCSVQIQSFSHDDVPADAERTTSIRVEPEREHLCLPEHPPMQGIMVTRRHFVRGENSTVCYVDRIQL